MMLRMGMARGAGMARGGTARVGERPGNRAGASAGEWAGASGGARVRGRWGWPVRYGGRRGVRYGDEGRGGEPGESVGPGGAGGGGRGEPPAGGRPEPPPGGALVAATLARAELGLDHWDFELAVRLGQVRAVTVPAPASGGSGPPGRRMVARAELDRLKAEPGFPEGLRARLRLVGAVTGAELLGISRDRFVRLSKADCFRPARWYVNRYHAVVWLYLADEVTDFAAEHPDWMTGRLPEEVRERLDDGLDLRGRGWRARTVGQLVARAPDAWHEAAVWLALLGPDEAADLLPADPERSRLLEARPSLLSGRPVGRAAAEPADVPLTADDPEEITFARRSLTAALERAARGQEPPDGSCCRTVTSRAQRWPWPRRSLPPSGPHVTRRGPRQGGVHRPPPRHARPDQSKGRR